MKRLVTLVAIVLLAGIPRAGRTCDACLEDKIAATYDWQVIADAARARHTVVFTAIRGPAGPNAALERAIRRALAAVPGVDPGTVRVSLAPPAASFACDPARRQPRRLVAAMSRALASRRLSLTIVRVGAPGSTVAIGKS